VLIAAPIVTMKIAAVNGRSVADLLAETPKPAAPEDGTDDRQRRDPRRREGQRGIAPWTLQHEYRSTYRGALTRTEQIVAGEFTAKVAPGTQVVPISLEQGLFEDMHLKLGDEIDWDVQGVPLRTKVSSVRHVEWRRMEPNFFVVFPEGVLDAAPKFFVVAMRADTPEISGRVQRAVVARFPNATAIDLALVLHTLDSIFSKVAFVIQFMALFTVATGVVVLVGAVLTGRYQRVRETVLLRTVGATRRQLTRIMLVEYGVLGALAALTGGVLAVIGNALLAKFVFHAAITVAPLDVALAFAIAVAVTLIAGVVANRGVTNHPPLEVLRQET
jgi:putative ABC transport system permease protein